MKTQALSLSQNPTDPRQKLNVLQEYIQAFVLRSLHESESFSCLSFVGGTALRFLFGLPRFSEDLDFCLEAEKNYAPRKWLEKLKRDLDFAQFTARVSWSEKTNVHVCWVKIPGLLKEAGLSAHAEQTLSVKIEIDTRPPAGAITEKKVINKYFLMAIRHHDLPSLMAGKIHALGCRQYVKGRDYYDLLWYRTQTPPVEPNLALLQNAVDQTEKKSWEAKHWKEILKKKLDHVDFKLVVNDVGRFLENPREVDLLTKDYLMKAIGA